MLNNYVIGRGELEFADFKPGTQTPRGFRYIGNTPEVNLAVESETLDHTNSDRGVNEKDASIVLSTNRTASYITDNISVKNTERFFLGSSSVIAIVGGSVVDELIEEVEHGLSYQLGVTNTNPMGARNVSAVTVKSTAPTPVVYVLDTDYTVDLDHARVVPVEGGAITSGSNIAVSYTQAAHSRERILSGSKAIEGSLRYTEYNPHGTSKVWLFPYVKITPNGDWALKGDEWQQIPFNVEILKLATREAIYIDGAPFTPSP